MKLNKRKISFLLAMFLVLGIFAYGYSQYLKKGTISAALQYQLDLNDPPPQVYAVLLSDQVLPDGKKIEKGTRFIGMLSKEETGFILYFGTAQNPTGKIWQIIAKSSLSSDIPGEQSGISAKLGMTLYKQTKTNVLGAIFRNSPGINVTRGSIIPQGSPLKIEVN